jgi:hypothetical protein
MPRLKPLAVAICLLGLLALPTAGADIIEVDAAIVLAADSSTSMDPERADRQRLGHADALRSREVISAISQSSTGCIALTYFEWASVGSLRTVMPWRVVCNEAELRAAAQAIEDGGDTGYGRSRGGRTSISFAIGAASLSLRSWQGRAARTVIDISVNGTNNDGVPVEESRRRALAEGHVINAIALDREEEGVTDDLAGYLRANVVGGPGAFAMVSNDRTDYVKALQRKLAAEISGVFVPADAAAVSLQ